MLRNILSKLPVLNNISDVPASPCNVRMLRSLSPTARDCRRDTESKRHRSKPIQKRSYSFPSTRQKLLQANEELGQYSRRDKNYSQNSNSYVLINHRDMHEKSKAPPTFRKEHSEEERYNGAKTKRDASEPAADVKKYYNYEVTEQYELEASKPRKSQSELTFNVFKHMEQLESRHDPIDHLQPNNLRPFGSMDNVYCPVMVKNRGSNILQLPKSSTDRETENLNLVKANKNIDNPQHREYSTKTRSFYGSPKGPVELIDNLPPFDGLGHYKTINPRQKQPTKQAVVPIKNFLSKPTPNKEVEEALGVAQECRKKLIESKYKEVTSGLPWYDNQVASPVPDTLVVDDTNEAISQKKSAIKLTAPWLSYSESLKHFEDGHSQEPEVDNAEVALLADEFECKSMAPQKRSLSTETSRPAEIKSKNNTESILRRQNTARTLQKRTLATEPKKNVVKDARSELHVSAVPIKPSLPSEKTYIKAKSYGRTSRPLEPKCCEHPPERKKCFLPSKIRLKPPICTPRPPPCPVKEPCVRSDDCLKVKPKKLPIMKASACPCVEEVGPNVNPKMKRLCFTFKDPPRICPEVPSCPPRADDGLVIKTKKLGPLKSDCVCVEPPPMIDVKLKRLQKVCVPEEKCYPKPECPPPPPCVRADDSLKVCEKALPPLQDGPCPCVELHTPNKNPKMKRLKFCFPDPPRPKICEPIEPCPPRADTCLPVKQKKLPKFEPSNCVCVDQPPMVDVPLRRLQKVCIPESKCYPKKECPVPEPCVRADDCWSLKVKPLPTIKDGPCVCVEPFVPDKNPKLKRLEIECEDQPRPPICEPVNPCPPRADENLRPKIKKLPNIEMGCKCVDTPPMTDVPLKRLQKVCVPEERCYPKKECPPPEPCIRADDGLCAKVKPLPVLDASDCPCVDPPPLRQAPILKRLDLEVCEPPRVCPPPEVCEEVSRADNHQKKKAKKLPKLKAGDCPCVDTPMVEAPRLKRLVCEDEPGECLVEDPCVATPRADMGCWEYYQPVETAKCDSKKDSRKGVDYNSKRRYNTDSRINLGKNLVENRKSGSVQSSRHEKGVARNVSMLSRSTTTIELLRKLGDLEKKTVSRIAFDVTPKTKLDIRKMSMSSNPSRGFTKIKKVMDIKKPCDKKKSKCHKVGSSCGLTKTGCSSTKCQVNCKKEPMPVCCEKKASPYPAFSELAEEEVEPFSEHSQFTCGRKEYGFHPKPRRLYCPSTDGKDKKKYSTLVTRAESRDEERSDSRKVSRPCSSAGGTRLDDKGNTNTVTSQCENNIAYLPLEPKLSQLLKQRANYGVVGMESSIPKISNYDTHPALSRPRSIHDISRNISIYSKHSKPITRNKSSSSKKPKKCKPKKKCPKFDLENCPEATSRPNCEKKPPIYVCIKEKSRAPYPAFTDCLDEELSENLSECPMEKEKFQQMQPKFMQPLDRPNLTKPVDPIVGKLDPMKEHECVKAKLAIENRGLSQSCHDFGKAQKVMRARNYLKEINKDCVKIERLRKLGKWPPKNSRGLCQVANNSFCIQRRGVCKTARNLKVCDNQETNTTQEKRIKQRPDSLSFNACPKNIYARKYHVLCTKPKKKPTDDFDIRPNEVSQYQLTEDESCKFMKLRNVQWRINNFQKWHRLQRLNSFLETPKKFSSSTSSRTKKFAHLGHSQKTFSTSAIKFAPLEPLETHREMSTTYILAADSDNKRGIFSLKSKRSKKSNSCPTFSLPEKDRSFSSKKLPSPYPAFSECKDYDIRSKICECPIRRAQIQQLQPQYPILPEISSGSLPETPQLDFSIDEEYAREKYGLKKEGVTLDCDTFGIKQKPLFSKIAEEKYEKLSMLSDCPEESDSNAHTDEKSDWPPKWKPKTCEKKVPECIPIEKPVKPETVNVCQQKEEAPCTNKEPTLWRRVVDYFKARPNCPSPDDWKKKAAREKAEKYAKMAGLVVCDPKDLPDGCGSEELPKVIVPKCPKFPFKCDSNQSKRSYSTTCIIQDCSHGVDITRSRSLCIVPLPHCQLIHRRFSTNAPIDDQNAGYSDEEDTLKQKTDAVTSNDKITDSNKIYYSTSTTPVGDEDRDSLDGEDVMTKETDTLRHETNESNRGYFRTVSGEGIEDRNILDGESTMTQKKSIISSRDKRNLTENRSAENKDEIGKRFYSTHPNRYDLEDINQSLEEDEKKELAKKILKPYIESAAEEEYFQEAIRSRSPQETENHSTPMNQRRLSFFDVMFHEPNNDIAGYDRAKTFAAFREIFHRIDVYSDVNYEEMEKNKTNELVQELDQLMKDKNQEEE